MEYSKPLITVITPTYNRAHIIERAIESVRKQTFKNYEYLIIDDGSKDNTLELIKKYTDKDPRIKFHLHEYNQGQNAALNTGLLKAEGKYIAFLDSDDEWLPHYLESQLNEFLLDPEVGCSYCWAGYLDKNMLKISRKYTIKGYLYKEALEQGYICNPTSLMVKKESLDTLGGFNLEFVTCQDDDICLRLAKANKFALIKEALVVIHNDAGNQTITNRHVYANDWLKLFNKYEKEILEYCGPKTLSRHYTKASLLFLKIYNKDTSREIINKALRYQKNPKALSIWASTFLPIPILKIILNLKKIVQ